MRTRKKEAILGIILEVIHKPDMILHFCTSSSVKKSSGSDSSELGKSD